MVTHDHGLAEAGHRIVALNNGSIEEEKPLIKEEALV
jgi:predicted ABC-type transport system involved in lysophospholipase L1 biosynthesis ATPase subunit